jgi:hypothetical protein
MNVTSRPVVERTRGIDESPVPPTRQRDPYKKALKLDALRKKQDALRAKIAKLEAREKAANRREVTRLKVIVGSAILAMVDVDPEVRQWVTGVLEKTVAAHRDREFLKAKNWL